MLSRTIAVFALALLCSSANAWSDSTRVSSGGKYFFSLHSGCLAGKKGEGTVFTASLVQGVRFSRLAVGLGAGYDAYGDWRVIPFFASVSYDLLRLRENAFFLQMNGGVAKAWVPMMADFEVEYQGERNLNINPVAGYRITGDKFNLYITVGYKLQRLKYDWLWSPGVHSIVDREIGRLSMQLGFGFH